MSDQGFLTQLAEGLKSLVSPNTCRVCGQTLVKGEETLCLGCLLQLPRTHSHRDSFNEIHRRLGHHFKIDRAAGWFHYKKDSPYAHLLVDSKYNGLPKIDRILGEICARELNAEHFFDGIDVLIPMPMHWTKRLLRGYNQANEICRGISNVTGIACCETLCAAKSHGTQARHNKTQRHSAVANTMVIKDPAVITGKNILIVDDIITTGASCIEAVRVLSSASPSSINILALGLTAQQSL